MTDQTQEAEQLIREYAEMWSEKDTDRIQDLVAESFNGEFPEGDVQGQEELEGFMREFTSAFPDFQVEIQDLLSREDTVVAEGRYTMTHQGEFEGIQPTERTVELPATAKFRVEGGKIQEHREFHDRQALLEQLGVTER